VGRCDDIVKIRWLDTERVRVKEAIV
jgi:hypothetical protein